MKTWGGSVRPVGAVALMSTRLLALLMVTVSAVTACALLDSPQGRAFDISGETDTTADVTGRWTITVPVAAAPTGAQLRTEPVDAAVTAPWTELGATPLAALDVSLSSGQPTQPLTFMYRLDGPLPPGEVLFLADDRAGADRLLAEAVGDGAIDRPTPGSVLVATMNADRTIGTVTTDHLSLKTWLTVGGLTEQIGKLLQQRHDPPTCAGERPKWLTEEPVFLDDANAPMRVCVGTDPARPELAVVKIANNRGGAILVTTPATPTWTWQSITPSLEEWMSGLIEQGLAFFEVPAAERSRTWILPAGEQVHIGIAESMITPGQPFIIRGQMTEKSAAWGAAMNIVRAITGVQDWHDPARIGLTAWQLATIGLCAQTIASAPGLPDKFVETGRCILERSDAIVGLLIDRLGPQAWNTIKQRVLQAATKAKFVGGVVVAIGAGTFAVTDLVTTMLLDEGAWTIGLFVLPTRRGFTLGLGGTIGDNSVFADADETVAFVARALGKPESDTGWIPPRCGPAGDVEWRLVRWGAFQLQLQHARAPLDGSGTFGERTRYVAGWSYSTANGAARKPPLRTAEGITLGSTRANLEAAYPGELSDDPLATSAGGGVTVFRGDYSNITFEFDSEGRVELITSGQSGCGD